MTKAKAIAIAHGLGAMALAVGLLSVGATAADTYHLPFIHGWALMHGAIFVVFPAYFVVSYLLIWPLAKHLRSYSPETPAPDKRISVWAILSFLLSGVGFLIPFVGSALGVAAGHIARRRIKANAQLGGSGFALAGLILGYLGLAYSIYLFGMMMIFWVASSHGS